MDLRHGGIFNLGRSTQWPVELGMQQTDDGSSWQEPVTESLDDLTQQDTTSRSAQRPPAPNGALGKETPPVPRSTNRHRGQPRSRGQLGGPLRVGLGGPKETQLSRGLREPPCTEKAGN